jgi:hypothetical protein
LAGDWEEGASDDYATQFGWRTVRATILAARGDVVEAERLAGEAVQIGERTDFFDMRGDSLVAQVEVLHTGGREGEARAAAMEAIRLYRQWGTS